VHSYDPVDGGSLQYDTLVLPIAESRSSESPLFSSSKKFLEAIAFLASHGPLNIVLIGQGFDVLYTNITKLVRSFDMVAVHWSFAIGIHLQ
jgi:hypothetical protein